MASHPNWHMFLFISPIICAVTASILVVVTDPSSPCASVLNHCQWPFLFLLLAPLLLLPAFFLREKRSSSLTSFVVPERKYDVFLSFRGTDTRDGFLSHLRGAFDQQKVDYFADDQNLQLGNEISPALITAIEQSEICLVIFSENYASSGWCLEELAHIIECKKNHNQIVVPVFYKVDPSTVRHQKESYRDAFAGHKKRFGKCKVQKWRDALKKAADLSGLHSSDYKTDAILITQIVQCVLQKLKKTSHYDLKGYVGIQERVTYLETLMRKKSQNVYIIGIWGPGGIGKTTIAEFLFKRLQNEYEGACFLRAREGLNEHGTIQLKEKLLSELLGEDPGIVISNGILSACERRLCRKKVLVAVDDINKTRQLEMLIGRGEWFGSDSRIIVTSRNRDTIKMCDFIYEVTELNYKKALQLFNLEALGEICLDKEHECYELSKQVVEYARGNPLAIKILGSSLYGRNEIEWKSKLKKLDKILDPEIQDVLQLSYDDLDDKQKDIFLYLACFFREDSEERIIALLDDDHYYTIEGLRVLQNKALITISDGGIVSMHNLIQKMGCEIVRRKCPKNPGQRNHLWNSNGIYEVLKNNKGTEEIESIRLQMWRLKRDLHLTPQAFARMDNLKLLRFEDYGSGNEFKVHVPEEGIILPNKLRSLHWDLYPSKSLPLRSCVDNLVELRFTQSRLQKLWDGIQELPNLKVADFSWSKELIELPDLSKAPNLKHVCLICCDMLSHFPLICVDNLEELCITQSRLQKLWDGIKELPSLEDVVLSKSKELIELPDLSKAPNLKYLNLEGCEMFSHFPLICMDNLVDLCITHSRLQKLWDGIKELPSLKIVDLSWSKELIELPDLSKAPNLKCVRLFGCKMLSHFPSICVDNLVELLISHSRLQNLWDGIKEFPSLNVVNLSWSRELIEFSDLSKAPNLERVYLSGCDMLSHFPLVCMDNLVELRITHNRLQKLWDGIKELPCLKVVDFSESKELIELPDLSKAPNLEYVYLEGCEMFCHFPTICVDNLVVLRVTDSRLQKLWDGIKKLPRLMHIDLSMSKELIELPDLSKAPNLKYVDLSGCDMLSQVPLWPKHNMVELDYTECEESKKISLGSRLSVTSLSIEGSEEDDHLDLCGTSFPIKPSFKYYVLPSLQFLSLKSCRSLTELPDNIGFYLPSLQELILSGTNVETLPASIKHLSQLKAIDLCRCNRLRYIPELPPSMEHFDATECRSLETVQFTSNSTPPSHKEYELDIGLENCVKLDDHKLEAVASITNSQLRESYQPT